jgi:hypothetical protein
VDLTGNNLQRLAVEYELVAFNPDMVGGRCGRTLAACC